MPILTFKVSNEVADIVNNLAKKTGISRNEFLARALTSLLLQEELKGRDIRRLTTFLIKKGLQKNEYRARKMLGKSPFISTWIQIAPTLLSKLTRPPSRPVKDWELRILKDLQNVTKNMKFSSESNTAIAVELLSEMTKSLSQDIQNIQESMYKDKLKEILYHLVFSLFYPYREKASEVFLFLCNELKQNDST
ncbi:MAG: ribbon-helix-helix domain-containing protein [Candidatus Dadabacteria bacterium]|nr:ribbon-helix-helix domain-containing protein [Candidatus Dadabacteria bacterium]